MAGASGLRKLPVPSQGEATYDRDVNAWSRSQADLIRAGRFSECDVENVAEEIESVGRSERSAFQSQLARILQYLLKWDFQPEKRTRSWRHSIAAHRVRAQKLLKENPSFKALRDEIVSDAFDVAVADAVADSGLERDRFPDTCPYSFEDIMSRHVEGPRDP